MDDQFELIQAQLQDIEEEHGKRKRLLEEATVNLEQVKESIAFLKGELDAAIAAKYRVLPAAGVSGETSGGQTWQELAEAQSDTISDLTDKLRESMQLNSSRERQVNDLMAELQALQAVRVVTKFAPPLSSEEFDKENILHTTGPVKAKVWSFSQGGQMVDVPNNNGQINVELRLVNGTRLRAIYHAAMQVGEFDRGVFVIRENYIGFVQLLNVTEKEGEGDD